MMRTVSLRRRVVGAGVAVVVIVFAIVDVFVWVNVRDYLTDNLKRVLENRADLAVAFAPTIDPAELARLAGSEMTVSVQDPSGREIERGGHEEGTPPTVAGPPSGSAEFTRRVTLPNGNTVVLVASQANMERTLRRVAASQVLGTVLGLGLAVFLLTRASRIALRPIDAVVVTARQITSGDLGERLRPDRTDTELGRMARAFDEMLDALERAVADARASEETERRFLAEAAHQLRTPIAGIQSSVEALLVTDAPAEREALLSLVAKESSRAGRRVAGLLRMARLDRGGGARRRPCDVIALCREEVERTASLAPDLSVALHADESSVTCEVDPDDVAEALANLLDNARRHTRSRVLVAVSTKRGQLELRVEDDGPGIPPGDADRVFDRFVSLDGQGGAGLGLAIVRGIARSHSGEATYEDGGFVIRLPLHTPSTPIAVQSAPQSSSTRERAELEGSTSPPRNPMDRADPAATG
ncbi:MAG: HAMP domain-containing sensor histidine kinase [Acidimicrobiia bacterium]